MRVVLDTNILVSALLVKSGTPAKILEFVEQFELLTTVEMLAELERVLHYPRIQRKYSLTENIITSFVQKVRDASQIVSVQGNVSRISRDPKDDIFLACAVAGSADYIISGDLDLLVLETHADIPIVTPVAFLKLLVDALTEN